LTREDGVVINSKPAVLSEDGKVIEVGEELGEDTIVSVK
jgi:hypothetical protein